MLRHLLQVTAGMLFCWLSALPAQAESPQTFQIDGVDNSRGAYTGQLTLAPRADGRVDATRTVQFADGAVQSQRGVLSNRGRRLQGVMTEAAGAANRLEGRRGSQAIVSISIDPDAGTCRGACVSSRGVSRFEGAEPVAEPVAVEPTPAIEPAPVVEPAPEPPTPEPPPVTQTPSGETFAGRPIYDYEPEIGITDPKGAYRVSVDWDTEDHFIRDLKKLMRDPRIGEIEALVMGYWGPDSAETVDVIVANADKLSGIKAFFMGDIDQEESEISWITQSDLGPLLAALPNLEELMVRGGNELRFSGAFKHAKLKTLTVESGGMPAAAVRDIGALSLPALEELQLWLGTDEYGGDSTVADVAAILAGTGLPALKTLGLMNSDISNEIAEAVVSAPILERLEHLSLSMGTLTDKGAEHLVTSPRILGLKSLDLTFHWMTDAMIDRLDALAIKVGTGDQQEIDPDDPDWRYVEVGE